MTKFLNLDSESALIDVGEFSAFTVVDGCPSTKSGEFTVVAVGVCRSESE